MPLWPTEIEKGHVYATFIDGPAAKRGTRHLVESFSELVAWEHRDALGIIEIDTVGREHQADLWKPTHYVRTRGGEGWAEYEVVKSCTCEVVRYPERKVKPDSGCEIHAVTEGALV